MIMPLNVFGITIQLGWLCRGMFSAKLNGCADYAKRDD
jgi:hypothetical protein